MSRTTILNLAIFVALVAIVWLGLRPMYSSLKTNRAIANELKVQIVQEEEALEKVRSLQKIVESNAEKIETLQQAIPASRDIAAVIAIAEEASTKNGLALTGFDIVGASSSNSRSSRSNTSSVGSSALGSVTTQLTMDGRYSSLSSFLRNIENSFPLIDISNVSFELSPEASQEESPTTRFSNPQLRFIVTLDTYYSNK